MAEANAVIDEEHEWMKSEKEPRLCDAPEPVEVDYSAMRDFLCTLLPPGQRPNLSSHQVYSLLQKDRSSLEKLATRLQGRLDALQGVSATVEEITKSFSWRLTTPLRKLLDFIRR
jgi:hypothetical protein